MAAVIDRTLDLAQRTIGDLTRPRFLKQMVWAFGYWVVMCLILYTNIQIMKDLFPNPPQPPDLMFKYLPEMKIFIPISEGLISFHILLVLFILWQGRFEELPKVVFLVVTMYVIRAFTIILTPLGQIQDPSVNFSESHILAQTFYQGMYFSGHTGITFTTAFYLKGRRLRPVLFLLASAQGFSLVASHSHYTIDIVGAIFVAYFVSHFDFMRLVPDRLRDVPWLPWYDDTANEDPVRD
jgi:hypothetical protein